MYVLRYISTFQNIYLGLKLLVIWHSPHSAHLAIPYISVKLLQLLLETHLLWAGNVGWCCSTPSRDEQHLLLERAAVVLPLVADLELALAHCHALRPAQLQLGLAAEHAHQLSNALPAARQLHARQLHARREFTRVVGGGLGALVQGPGRAVAPAVVVDGGGHQAWLYCSTYSSRSRWPNLETWADEKICY